MMIAKEGLLATSEYGTFVVKCDFANREQASKDVMCGGISKCIAAINSAAWGDWPEGTLMLLRASCLYYGAKGRLTFGYKTHGLGKEVLLLCANEHVKIKRSKIAHSDADYNKELPACVIAPRMVDVELTWHCLTIDNAWA